MATIFSVNNYYQNDGSSHTGKLASYLERNGYDTVVINSMVELHKQICNEISLDKKLGF